MTEGAITQSSNFQFETSIICSTQSLVWYITDLLFY